MPLSTLKAQPASIVAGLVLLLSSASPWAEQPLYPTPEAAVQALVEAAASEQPNAVIEVLGPGADELRSGDPVADAAERRSFAEAATEATRIERHAEDLATLNIGAQDWPFPIPLSRAETGWHFDVASGKEEMLNRRIGRNEIHAIAVARAYVEAQHEYAAEDRNGDGKREYAQKIMSSEDARDGLYWPTGQGEPLSPFGRLVAGAVAKGYEAGDKPEPEPYYGYLYRVLTAQGDKAPGGTRDWTVDGRLTKGFGLIAYPAQYGNSGITTFLVNQSGLVRELDLGKDTAQLAAAIAAYDPDSDWRVVTD